MDRPPWQHDARQSYYLIHLARLCHQQGRKDEGQTACDRAIEIQKCLLPPDDEAVSALLRLVNQVADRESQGPVGASIAVAEYMYSPGYLSAMAARALAGTYREADKMPEAQILYLYELETLTRVFGPDHQCLATTLQDLGEIAEKQGETAAAIRAYEEVWRILIKTGVKDMEQSGEILWRTAHLYRETGELSKSKRALQALALMAPSRDDSDPDRKALERTYFTALVHYEMDDLDTAVRLAKNAVCLLRKVNVDQGSQGELLYLLGLIHLERGMDGHKRDFQRARLTFRKALHLMASCQEDLGARLADIMVTAAEASDDLDKYQEAERLYRKALAIRRRVNGPDSEGVARVLNDLALTLLSRGAFDQARQSLQAALRIARKHQDATGRELIAPLSNLAVMEAIRHRYDVAARLNQQAIEIIERHHAGQTNNLMTALQNQGDLLAMAGCTAEAEATCRKALKLCAGKVWPDRYISRSLRAQLARLRSGRFKGKPADQLWRTRSRAFDDQPTSPAPTEVVTTEAAEPVQS